MEVLKINGEYHKDGIQIFNETPYHEELFLIM